MLRFLMYCYTLLLCLFAFACNQVQQEEKYKLPSESEINEVIQAIIVQDSLFYGEQSNIPLSIDLYKLDIYFPDTALFGQDPPPVPWKNNFYELIGIHGENAPFTVLDSSYLHFQNRKLQELELKKANHKDIKLITYQKQKQKLKTSEESAFYYFSIPLFDNDQSRAYVELMFICWKLCGYGNGYVLEKRKGNWVIVQKEVKWYE